MSLSLSSSNVEIPSLVVSPSKMPSPARATWATVEAISAGNAMSEGGVPNQTSSSVTSSIAIPNPIPVLANGSANSTTNNGAVFVSNEDEIATANSPPTPRTCWSSKGEEEGYSMSLATSGDDEEYVCISFCYDCAALNHVGNAELCTDEQREKGTKMSISMALPYESLELAATDYADFGFTSCMTDDCNKGDACGASSNDNGDVNFDTTSPPSVSVSLDTLSSPYTMTVSSENPSSTFSRYGSSVAISGDGSLMAVGSTGAVYLYALDNTATTDSNSLSLLQVFYGQSSNDEFGNAIALSQNGNRLVVGSRSENGQKGAMRVFQRDDASMATPMDNTPSWSLMEGGVISGQSPSDRAGWSVSISLDGSVIAMGSPKGGTEGGGSVLSYKYNTLASGWYPYGPMIQGLTSGESAGYSISLSNNGSTMAVGSSRSDNLDGSSFAGKTAVYFMIGSEWQVLGEHVYGEAEGDGDGTSVATSLDGSVLVVGGKGRRGVDAITGEVTLESAGQCRIYQFISGQWEFQYRIVGTASEERLGSSVAISADGNIVACGGNGGSKDDGDAGDSTAKRTGVVRLWNRSTLQESTIWPREGRNDLVGAATFGTSMALSADGKYVIVGAPTWNDGANNGGDTSAGAIQIFTDV